MKPFKVILLVFVLLLIGNIINMSYGNNKTFADSFLRNWGISAPISFTEWPDAIPDYLDIFYRYPLALMMGSSSGFFNGYYGIGSVMGNGLGFFNGYYGMNPLMGNGLGTFNGNYGMDSVMDNGLGIFNGYFGMSPMILPSEPTIEEITFSRICITPFFCVTCVKDSESE